MKYLFLSLVLLCLVLGCTNPATQPANSPPNPPIVVDTVSSIPYQTIVSITISFSDPKDPDAGDIAHMEVVESKMIDASGNVIGSVPVDLLSNADPRFTDPLAGTFSVDGLTSLLLGYTFDYMGILVRCVDQSGGTSATAMIKIRFGGT